MPLHAKRLKVSLIALILLSVLAVPLVSHAQTPSQIVINYPELTDLGDSLQLGLYFTITDSSGRVVPSAKVESAQILLDDGERDDNATVEQPTTPFFITLVLDASGSMGGAANDMRQAAIQAIQDAPDNARFAVIRFNEKIDLLQEFTEDRNSAINAVGEVQPVNLSGTCLYDAAYQAVTMMSNAPSGRRAIIVFTDGKDEVLSGDPCSRNTLQDVISKANAPESRVPIHTIGMSTNAQNINAGELRSMASETGGLSAIGDQAALSDLFQQIIDALKSQWLAQGVFYPLRGPHTATLTVQLDDGTTLSAVTTFEVLRDFQVPITPSATATPIVVEVEIRSVTPDRKAEVIYIDVDLLGEEVMHEYQFDFFDADTNVLLYRHPLPAPLPDPIAIPTGAFNGDIRVELRVIGPDGRPLRWQGERSNNMVDMATYEFSYFQPTATPLPPELTDIPITVTIDSVQYDIDNDVITLNLSFTGRDQINELEVNITDEETGVLVRGERHEPGASVQMGGQGLIPLKAYEIRVIARGANDENLATSKDQPLVYTPYLTPTPTSTYTPSPTATKEPVTIAIIAITPNEAEDQLTFSIEVSDEEPIETYELQIIDSSTSFEVARYSLTPPPYTEIRIPLSSLPGGQYSVRLRAIGFDGTRVADTSISFEKLATPTPMPTATPTITPTATSEPSPGFTERVGDAVRDNPSLAGIIALIGLGLILVLIILFRPRRKQQTGTDFLSAQTGFYQMAPPPGEGEAAKPGESAAGHPMPAGSDEATSVMGMDPEKTDVYDGIMPPLASLRFTQYPEASRVGQSVLIDEFPFTVGRGTTTTNSLSLDADTSVSRRHATITFENGQFMLSDENSSNGTTLDGARLVPNSSMVLANGVRIMFGKSTEVIFTLGGADSAPDVGADDSDRTDYINIRGR